MAGFKIPLWKVRVLYDEFDRKKPEFARKRMSRDDFLSLCNELRSQDVAQSFKSSISKRDNLEHLGGMSEASSSGTTHSVRIEEQVAFSNWINK